MQVSEIYTSINTCGFHQGLVMTYVTQDPEGQYLTEREVLDLCRRMSKTSHIYFQGNEFNNRETSRLINGIRELGVIPIVEIPMHKDHTPTYYPRCWTIAKLSECDDYNCFVDSQLINEIQIDYNKDSVCEMVLSRLSRLYANTERVIHCDNPSELSKLLIENPHWIVRTPFRGIE